MFSALRLSRHIGPVIINLSQVCGDVWHMVFIWIWMTVAWTFGSMYMENNRIWLNKNLNNLNKNQTTFGAEFANKTLNKNQTTFGAEFAKAIHDRMWNLLVYEKKEIHFKNATDPYWEFDWINFSDGLMSFCYQSFIVVVCLNLLIAIMNATIQRFVL